MEKGEAYEAHGIKCSNNTYRYRVCPQNLYMIVISSLQRQLIAGGQLKYLDDLEEAAIKMRIFSDRVRRAAYGYAGFFDAVRVHSKLFPDLKEVRIYVDSSPTGRAISKQIKIEMEKEPISFSWKMKVIKNWNEYQKEIGAVNEASEVGAIYPAVLLLKDSDGTTYTAPDIFAWTAQNSNPKSR